ncbi:MAG: hypothetical protein LBR09_00945 [Endomicrobium sp.]|jgi:hypothetical protein|nr:hypothetical protein [Endomicrobium sp.]
MDYDEEFVDKSIREVITYKTKIRVMRLKIEKTVEDLNKIGNELEKVRAMKIRIRQAIDDTKIAFHNEEDLEKKHQYAQNVYIYTFIDSLCNRKMALICKGMREHRKYKMTISKEILELSTQSDSYSELNQ